MTIVQDGSSQQWASFLDVDADVLPWLQIPASQPANDPTLQGRLQLTVDMVCTWVQSFLGRPIAPTRFDRRFDGWTGWRGSYLMLPYRPVLEIVSVVEYWGVSGPHTLAESTPTAQVDGFQITPSTGLLARVFPGNVVKPFFPGSRNVEVVWVAGYNPVPADIKVAALEMVAYWYRNTAQVSGLRGPGSGNEYDPAPSPTGLWAGIPNRVKELLSPYLQVGIG